MLVDGSKCTTNRESVDYNYGKSNNKFGLGANLDVLAIVVMEFSLFNLAWNAEFCNQFLAIDF